MKNDVFNLSRFLSIESKKLFKVNFHRATAAVTTNFNDDKQSRYKNVWNEIKRKEKNTRS